MTIGHTIPAEVPFRNNEVTHKVNFDYQFAFGELVVFNFKKSDNQHRKSEPQIPEKIDTATMIFNKHKDRTQTIIPYIVNNMSMAGAIYQDLFCPSCITQFLRPSKMLEDTFTGLLNDIRDDMHRTKKYKTPIKRYMERHW